MSLFLIILLSVFLVIDCTILVFLVLMQLPKKEAGAGLAFGGAATDALFGAGSGNLLTKATKYTAGAFFVLAIALSLLQSYRANLPDSDFRQKVKAVQQQQPVISAPPAATPPPAIQSATNISGTNVPMLLQTIESNSPAAAPSNTAPVAPLK
jgi:preprotein translocase subunit SecG